MTRVTQEFKETVSLGSSLLANVTTRRTFFEYWHGVNVVWNRNEMYKYTFVEGKMEIKNEYTNKAYIELLV